MPVDYKILNKAKHTFQGHHYPVKTNLPPNRGDIPLSSEDISYVATYLLRGGVVVLPDCSVGPYQNALGVKYPCVCLDLQGGLREVFGDSFDGAVWLLHWHYWKTMHYIENKLNGG